VAAAFDKYLREEGEVGMLRLMPAAMKRYWKA
jgi:hypothetical protein